jgi:hypothetical protein
MIRNRAVFEPNGSGGSNSDPEGRIVVANHNRVMPDFTPSSSSLSERLGSFVLSNDAAANHPRRSQTAPPRSVNPEVASFGREIDPVVFRSRVEVGDVVFIRSLPLPFRKISVVTGSWTNHVGIIAEVGSEEPLVAESTFPFSRLTRLSRFIRRSEGGRVGVYRLRQPWDVAGRAALGEAIQKRLGVHYDTGFDLESRGQFCSRFVREVVSDATGIKLGEVERFEELLARDPSAQLGFWRLWYFGRIPWQRRTVTPASLLRSECLRPVFDGVVSAPARPWA